MIDIVIIILLLWLMNVDRKFNFRRILTLGELLWSMNVDKKFKF